MKQAVIFDLDGVIVFSENLYQKRRRAFFQQHDIYLTDEIQTQLVGSNPKDMFQLLIPEDVKKRKRLMQEFTEFRANYSIDYRKLLNPEIESTLIKLANQHIRLAVASSAPLKGIQDTLEINGLLNYFELLVSGEMFEKSKPNPEIYHYTVGKLGVAPDQCLVVEDSTIGVSAALAADLEVAALNNPNAQATYHIQSTLDVLKYVN